MARGFGKHNATPTAKQLWQAFQAASVPRTAPAFQHKEMEKAFYAGMASLLGSLENLDETLSDEEGAAILESYKQEIIKAIESFVRGDRP